MIVLGQYDEFCPGMNLPKLSECINNSPYPEKDRIVEYLKRGHIHAVTASPVIDVLTGMSAGFEKLFLDDGEYSWCNSLAYYVDKYNLRLDQEFERKVLAL